MDLKTTTTKPKTMGDVFEKSRKYDALLKENEELKKKLLILESANDGYRVLYDYQNSVINSFGKLLSDLIGVEYDPDSSAISASELKEVLREILVDTSVEAENTKKLFRDIYNKLYHPNYNPFEDIIKSVDINPRRSYDTFC